MRTTVLAAAALALTAVLTPAMADAGAAAPATAPAAASGPRLGPCGPGELCLWAKSDFKGARSTYELARLDVDSCVPLPAGASAEALANRTGRPVTTYQSEECDETGEFETYPGSGTWAPRSPYRIRAFKVWEN
ncbi:peptidase inhibitor family I36 protein [Streptomyces sp. NPDC051907]|uniref:peptidase inhibitor family I36 protein n=1 Tax=Streptomyces sp. NPDC051907 TaxID=3155284 RepID=UPI0034421A46